MSDIEIQAAIRNQLESVKDPESGRPLAKTQQIEDLRVSDGRIACRLRLTRHAAPIAEEFRDRFADQVRTIPGVKDVMIELGLLERPIPEVGQMGLRARSILAVGAGKGGVGKSSLAAGLALTLSRLGSRVGLMDADVYGPSIPQLLGLQGRPEILNGKIQPILSGAMPVISMGFLVERDQAVIWRGPMLHGSVTQFLRDTDWGELDYLIIDLPPGTGDVVLTLSQIVPLSGAIVVCTPQEVALLDARKAISMFEKTKSPILGLVENMSGFECPGCGVTYDLFGKGGAQAMAEAKQIPFLGSIPIQIPIRVASDAGKLAEVLESDPACQVPFEKIARSLVWKLAQESGKRGMGAPLPVL